MRFPVSTRSMMFGVAGVLALAAGAVGCTTASGPLGGTPSGNNLATTGASTFSLPDYASVAARTGAAYAQGVGQPEGIWVSGSGKVTVKPDLAVLRLGVEAQADTVAEARQRAAEAMQAIIDALKAAGVAEDDIQTQFFNIQPIYHWEEKLENGFRSGQQVLDGYRVTNSVTAKVRDLPTVGDVIDGAVAAGGDVTRIDGVNFTLEDPAAAEAEARKLATQDAITHAQQIAEAAGVGLGAPVYISESGGSPVSQVYEETFARGAAMDSGAPMPSTPIQTGNLEVVIYVQAVFGIGE